MFTISNQLSRRGTLQADRHLTAQLLRLHWRNFVKRRHLLGRQFLLTKVGKLPSACKITQARRRVLPAELTCYDNGGKRNHPWCSTAGNKSTQNYLPIFHADSAILSVNFIQSILGQHLPECATNTKCAVSHQERAEGTNIIAQVFVLWKPVSYPPEEGISNALIIFGYRSPMVVLRNSLWWNSSSSMKSSVSYRIAMLSSHVLPTPEMYLRMIIGYLSNTLILNIPATGPRTTADRKVLPSAIPRMFYRFCQPCLYTCSNLWVYLLALAAAMLPHRQNYRTIPPQLKLGMENLTT